MPLGGAFRRLAVWYRISRVWSAHGRWRHEGRAAPNWRNPLIPENARRVAALRLSGCEDALSGRFRAGRLSAAGSYVVLFSDPAVGRGHFFGLFCRICRASYCGVRCRPGAGSTRGATLVPGGPADAVSSALGLGPVPPCWGDSAGGRRSSTGSRLLVSGHGSGVFYAAAGNVG